MAKFLRLKSHDLDHGSGHVAHSHAVLIELQLNQIKRKNPFFCGQMDVYTDARLALFGRLGRGVNLIK